MGLEIERKFLVKNTDFKALAFKQDSFKQGYLNTDKSRTVRIRIANEEAFITVKGQTNATGTTRFEWEEKIKKEDAEKLLKLSETIIIEKTRYYLNSGNHVFEVDEFFGENKGLILAEIELNTEDEVFLKPNWLGKEVTGNKKYYNSYLGKKPYLHW